MSTSRYQDINQQADCPDTPLGAPAVLTHPTEGSAAIFFRTPEKHVLQLYQERGAWKYADLTVATHAQAADFDPAVILYRGYPQVFYCGGRMVHQLWWDGKIWHYNNLSALCQAPHGPVVAVGTPSVTTDGDGVQVYVEVSLRKSEVEGAPAYDRHIYQFWWDANRWHCGDISASAHATSQASGSPFASGGGHVFYVSTAPSGTKGAVNELWFDKQGWHHANLSDLAQAPLNAVGRPSGYYNATGGFVYYRGTDRGMHQLWWDGHTWIHIDISASALAPKDVAGDPCAYLAGENAGVAYIGYDNKLHLLWYDGWWQHANLSQEAGGPDNVGDGPAVYLTPAGEQHTVYRGAVPQHILALVTPTPQPERDWSIRMLDVKHAFLAVPDRGQIDEYTAGINIGKAHIQGMSSYRDYYLLPKNETDSDRGSILVLNTRSHKLVQKFDTPEAGYPHPDGGQVIGEYLAQAVENDSQGFVCFYFLGNLSDDRQPTLMPCRINRTQGAGAVGITDIGTGDQRRYLVAVYDDGGVTFYLSNFRLLDDPACAFSPVFTSKLPAFNSGEKSKGADNICLVTDIKGQAYLIGFTATAGVLDRPDQDWVGLYKVHLDQPRLEPCVERHMYTTSGIHVPILEGVSFRYGAGLRILSPTQMAFFCSARNFIGDLKINTFRSAAG